ncbi:splicing factor u2af-associated protein 2 [Stemphylium lycopersici]|uniref:Splicing factor u2af-associated protein 2 n=1 Tax=Stemphylium lycopersici TaxID=183478 RepID=A0A364MW07_STELY|nr:splicing factor u2af-associated protein 2 [Stemphylium lycopersici]RAR05184.1 splicing factor u2af-associated protein 2 [Stemphylium lycopersici]RAR07111.1 splicing factor u2af-associated protein 2 [Stemphylium lycopersici]
MSELDNFMGQPGERADSGTPPTDAPSDVQAGQNGKKRKNAKEPETNKKPKVMENKAIWISNLPPDTTAKEIEDEFGRFGIIDKGADGQPRIKMYTDEETGKFTGNAMVIYFRKEAITNAVNMMDDYVLRPGDYSNGTIRVEPASIEHKKERDGDKIASKLTRKDRKASERNRAELNRKLNEWSDNEEEVAEAFAPKKNKWAKVVIIKHAFTLAELDEEPEAYLEIKEEMREAAEEYGEVTNCTLYDKEPEGILTVRFREFEPAEKFLADYQGRGYQKRKLALSLAEDKPRFKKSAKGEEPDSEDEEQRPDKTGKAGKA